MDKSAKERWQGLLGERDEAIRDLDIAKLRKNMAKAGMKLDVEDEEILYCMHMARVLRRTFLPNLGRESLRWLIDNGYMPPF